MAPQALTVFNTARYTPHLRILEMKWNCNWLLKRYTCMYIYVYIHLRSNVHLTFGNIILFWYTNVPCSLSILCTGICNSHDRRVYKSDSNLHILFNFFPALVSKPSVFMEKYTSQ